MVHCWASSNIWTSCTIINSNPYRYLQLCPSSYDLHMLACNCTNQPPLNTKFEECQHTGLRLVSTASCPNQFSSMEIIIMLYYNSKYRRPSILLNYSDHIKVPCWPLLKLAIEIGRTIAVLKLVLHHSRPKTRKVVSLDWNMTDCRQKHEKRCNATLKNTDYTEGMAYTFLVSEWNWEARYFF